MRYERCAYYLPPAGPVSLNVALLNIGAQMPEMMEAEVPPKYLWSVFICENVGMLLGGTGIELFHGSLPVIIFFICVKLV